MPRRPGIATASFATRRWPRRDAAAAGAHREAAAQFARANPVRGRASGRRACGAARGARAGARDDRALRHRPAGVRRGRGHLAPARRPAARGVAARRHGQGARCGRSQRRGRGGGAAGDGDRRQPCPTAPEKVDALAAQAYLRMLDRDNPRHRPVTPGHRDGPRRPRAIASVVAGLEHARQPRGSCSANVEGGPSRSRDEPAAAIEHGLDRYVGSAYSVCASALGEMYRFTEAAADASTRGCA